MSAHSKRKTTRKRFEAELIEKHGFDNLTVSTYDEEQCDGTMSEPCSTQRLTLYYIPNPNERQRKMGLSTHHCATWTQGEGWEFNATTTEEEEAKQEATA